MNGIIQRMWWNKAFQTKRKSLEVKFIRKIVMNDDVQKDENKIHAKFVEIPIFDSEVVCCISIHTRII